MKNNEILALLPQALLPWYHENRRDLPWRQDRQPYHIWLSEIMLQQTRVEAVKGYYARFLAALPTIDELACCDDDSLHKLWEGLGYYSRVRNLKKAAQVIMECHGGVFPTKYEDVLALPGIGTYTAGAICSIAFGQPTPAVDGNVLRLVSRLTDDPSPINYPAVKSSVQQALAAVYPKDSGSFTQALMELGATLCGPNRPPECSLCPCRDFCLGHARGTAVSLPVKTPKKEKRIEKKTVFILRCDGRYALVRRPDSGLLAGLWEFPNVPGALDADAALSWMSEQGLHPLDLQRQVTRSHIFTHIRWEMQGFYAEAANASAQFCWFTPEQIRTQAALPTAFRQFWEEIKDV